MSTQRLCDSCGHPIPDDGAFCSQCGTQAHDPEKTVLAIRRIREGTKIGKAQCRSCNAMLHRDHIYCPFCGAKHSDVTAFGSTSEPEEDPMLERLAASTGDEFEIIRRLGRGGMGSVYLARESALQRFVAIKVLAPEFLADTTLLERFRTEARIVATLRHRSIVGIHTVRHTEDLHYFVMDYVEGASLSEVIKSHGPLPTPVVKAVLYEVGSALTYAHRQGGGIIHRDIKPGNIMLDSEGAVVVMDYGISKAVGTKAGLTAHGSIIGTPEYMSPEQCRGNQLTVASDQYALGLLGYAMLSGAPPFSGPQWVVIASQIQEIPAHISEIRADCPEDLAESVHRMLAKLPGDRWPSIPDALKAFEGRHHDLGDPVREETGRLVRESEGMTAVQVPVSRLELEAPPDAIEPGDELALNAEIFDDLGRVLSGREIRWSTSDPNIVMVSPEGDVEARAPGTAVVTAAVDDVDSTLELTVREPTPASIGIEPPSVLMHVRDQAVLSTVLRDRRTNPIERDAHWSSSDGSVVSVSQAGELHALAPGVAVITAEVDGLSAHAEVSVEHAPVTTIVLLQIPEMILVGDEFQLEAQPRGAGDHGTLEMLWRSSNDRIASVDGGLVRARSAGIVTVTAAVAGTEASAHLVVAERVAGEVVLRAPRNRLEVGEEMSLSARARDQRGEPLEPEMRWNSSDPSVASVDEHGNVRALAEGTAEVRVVTEGVSEGVVLTVVPESVHVIELAAPTESLVEGASLALAVVVRDARGRSLEGRDVEWEVSDEKIATVTNSGVLTGVGPGAVTVTAISGGKTSSIVLRVSEIAVAAVRVSAPPAEVRVGARFELRATATSSDGEVLQRRIEWASTDPSIALVRRNGEVEAKSKGRVEITATAGGVEGAVHVTVAEAAAVAQAGAEADVGAGPKPGAKVGARTDGEAGPKPGARADATAGAEADAAAGAEAGPRAATEAGPKPGAKAGARAGRGAASGPGAKAAVPAGKGARRRPRWLLGISLVAVPIVAVIGWQQFSGREGEPAAGPAGATASVTYVGIGSPPDGVRAGDTVPLSATAFDADGAPVTGATLEWRVDDPEVATVDQSGVLVASLAGVVTVSASAGGVEGTLDLPIAPRVLPGDPAGTTVDGPATTGPDERPTIASVDVRGPSGPLRIGDAATLVVTARDDAGVPLATESVDWTVEDEQVASVDQTGTLVGRAAGTTRVTATADGVQGFVDIEVAEPTPEPPPETAPPPVASVALTVTGTMEEGSSQSYRVDLFDAQGTRLSAVGRTVTVRASTPSLVVDAAGGRVNARAPGSAYLIAAAEGVGDSVQVVVEALVAAVVIQGDAGPLAVDASVALQAEVRGSQRQPLSGRTVLWSSTDPGVLTVDQAGQVIARAPGSADVVASSGGVEGRLTFVVEAPPPPAPTPPTSAQVTAEAERYAGLLNSQDVEALRALFGADSDADGNRALLDRVGQRDFAARVTSVGPATLAGDEATARFGLQISYRDGFGRNRERTGEIVVVLTRTSDGWRLQRCSVAPGSEF